MARERLGSVDEYPDESLTARTVGGVKVVVVRHGGAFYVVPDRCTHARFPLSDGSLDDGALVCAYHGARFDLVTGRPTLPAVKPLARFPVEVEGDELFVTVP